MKGQPVQAAPTAAAAKPIRIGYARCSTAQKELQSQLDALEPVYKRIFSEKISMRVKTWPKLEAALKLAYDIKEAAADREVILTVHELQRLARNAAELMTLTNQLQRAGVQLCSSPSSPSPPSSTATTSGRRPIFAPEAGLAARRGQSPVSTFLIVSSTTVSSSWSGSWKRIFRPSQSL